MYAGTIVNVRRTLGRGHRMAGTPARIVAKDGDKWIVELPVMDATRRFQRQRVSAAEIRQVTDLDRARIAAQFKMQEEQ